jgi:hypothetical protein
MKIFCLTAGGEGERHSDFLMCAVFFIMLKYFIKTYLKCKILLPNELRKTRKDHDFIEIDLS